MKFFSIIIILYSLSFPVLSKDFDGAMVNKVIGKVSVLIQGQREAQPVIQGQIIPEDSSILTYDKSFVSLQLSDGSLINIAENSKMYINNFQKKEKPSLLTILKGKLRASVINNKNDKVKMILKTRQAAMGVRGTDFLIAYDSDKDAVSLVTFEGKVAFIKKEDKETGTLDVLKNELQNTNNLIVDGEFAGVNNVKTTQKIKISQTQIESFKQSFETSEKEKIQKKMKIENDEFIVDLKTGQAVKGYTGFVDLATGEYTPIEGIELTNKGFVPKNKENSNSLKTALKFNTEINNKKFWINRFTITNELYSQRNEFVFSNGKVAVKDDGILKNGFKFERSDLENSYYGIFSFFNLNPKSLGAIGGIQGAINNKMNMKSFTVGYEKRLSDKINVYSDIGMNDTLGIENNVITKTSYQFVSFGAKYKFFNINTLYPYIRGEYEIKNDNFNKNSIEIGLGATKEFNNFGIFTDIWANRAKNEQKGGLLLGFFYDF